MSNKPMRAVMPGAAAIVDAFRGAGLTDNEAIQQGMRTGGFHASENGHEVGRRAADGVAVQPVLSMAAEKRVLDLWWKRAQTSGFAQK